MEKKPLYSFCHGWTLDPRTFNEITCKQRERCQYFDIDFYRHHGDHLDDFDEMFPMEPCLYFLERAVEVKEEKTNEELFAAFVKGKE